MLLYYITDRRQFPGDERERRRRLIDKIAESATFGVDYIQLREKDLPARQLETLAAEAVEAIRDANRIPARHRARLLLNSRADVALAVAADGVHLRSDDVSAADVRAAWMGASRIEPVLAVSCHTREEIDHAASDGADFAVFAPVFEKQGSGGVGLAKLKHACAARPVSAGVEASPPLHIAVLALGGVTLENARDCLRAGAAGVAGIRLFQENDVSLVVNRLRE